MGFSTQDSATTGVRAFYDIELINRDLTAAFQTRVGERVMRPDFGCKLWDYCMEPLTGLMREKIVAETTRICALDPRLITDLIQVTDVSLGFRVDAMLEYLPWRIKGAFSKIFERDDQNYFGY